MFGFEAVLGRRRHGGCTVTRNRSVVESLEGRRLLAGTATAVAMNQMVGEGSAFTFKAQVTDPDAMFGGGRSYTVGYSITGVTAGADHDGAATGSVEVVIVAGTYFGSATVPLLAKRDNEVEGPEDAVFTITSISGGGSIGSPSTASTRITDDPPVTGVTAGVDLSEGDIGSFTIWRSGGDQQAELVVGYEVGGTASPGADYEPLAGSVTFAAGVSSVMVTVTTLVDTDDEEVDESVEVTLSSFGGTHKRGNLVLRGMNGFYDFGKTSDQVLWWVSGSVATGGGAGNQALGSIQREVAPEIVTGTTNGSAWAQVKAATGLVVIKRSYRGVKAGDQGVGAANGSFSGKRVYVTSQLASDLNAHEQGHVLATGKVYNLTAKLSVDTARQYRDAKYHGAAGDTEAQTKQKLLDAIKWDERISAFKQKDIDVNRGQDAAGVDGHFHTWETQQGGGPFANTRTEGGLIGGIQYDNILRSRSETEPNYMLPDYRQYNPPA